MNMKGKIGGLNYMDNQVEKEFIFCLYGRGSLAYPVPLVPEYWCWPYLTQEITVGHEIVLFYLETINI